mgnify:CR=1 FL=1
MIRKETQSDVKIVHKLCECGRTIIGRTQNQLDYNMKLHLDSKDHKRIMELFEEIKVVKRQAGVSKK